MPTFYLRVSNSLKSALDQYVGVRSEMEPSEIVRYIVAIYLRNPNPDVLRHRWTERKPVKLSFNLPDATQTAVHRFAREHDISSSDVVRQAIYQAAVLRKQQAEGGLPPPGI